MLKNIYHKVESIFPQIKILKAMYLKIPGRGMPRRYKYLLQTIKENKAKRIMEIGTWRGQHALEMIEEAKKYFPATEIEYYGFDLFELLNDETSKKEFSIPPPSVKEIKRKLEKTGAKINLYKGYSQETLPALVGKLPEMDFIYIDGGHSIETIASDWQYAQKFMGAKTIVIFDDYWNRDDAGCKNIIEKIDKSNFDVKILPIQDRFKKDWGILTINFAQIKRK